MSDVIKLRAFTKIIKGLKSEIFRYNKKAVDGERKMKIFKKKMEILKSELSQFKNKKRRSRRIVVGLGVELIASGKRYVGFIKSISEHGVYLITAPTKTAAYFLPGTILKLKIQILSGETLNLNCEVK